MGESDLGSRPFSFNGSIDVKAVDESVSADAGALPMRELMERTGIVRWLEEHLIDDRRPGSVSHSVGSLLRTSLLLIAQGHSDQDDADRLRSDPSLQASAREPRGVADEGYLASQPTLSRFLGMLSGEENLTVLCQGILKNGIRRLRQAFCAYLGAPGIPDWVTVDIDDVPFLVHGEQPGSGYNAYVGHECYHAVVSVCGESGDILGARLRKPGEDRAQETHDLALEAADALFDAFPGVRVLIRMDAGFPGGRALDTFEELNVDYLARIRNNPVLNRMAEPPLERPGDLEADEVRTVFQRDFIPGGALEPRKARGSGGHPPGTGVVSTPLLAHHQSGQGGVRRRDAAEAVPGSGQGRENLRRTEDRPRPATVVVRASQEPHPGSPDRA